MADQQDGTAASSEQPPQAPAAADAVAQQFSMLQITELLKKPETE